MGLRHGTGDRPWSERRIIKVLEPKSAFALEDLPLFLSPLLGQSSQVEPPADDELALTKNLRLPTPGLPVEAQLLTPHHMIVPEGPQVLARLWLPAGGARMLRAIEGVVAHEDYDTATRDRGGPGRSLFVPSVSRKCRQRQRRPPNVCDASSSWGSSRG